MRCHHPMFRDQKTEGLSNLSKVLQLVGRSLECLHVMWAQLVSDLI